MITLDVPNVHHALPHGLFLLEERGVRKESRNGPVLVAPCPVTTVYRKPDQRVIFWPERDANPFFHLYESMWMLLGRNDVEGPSTYAPNMRRYSDDGETFHGAYGHRWVKHFGVDQLDMVANELKQDPDSRRCVVQMWDARVDLGHRTSKDLPCNTQLYFWMNAYNKNNLDMTICCRSNDIIWGAYGANAVHFSFLQEFMAALIGCEIGRMYQMSNNFHAYLSTFEPLRSLGEKARNDLSPDNIASTCPYDTVPVLPYPLISGTPVSRWLQELDIVLSEGHALGVTDPWLRHVLIPMMQAHGVWRTHTGKSRYTGALEILYNVRSDDWRIAATEWIQRRYDKWLKGEVLSAKN